MGDYVVTGEISAGGMGVVYRAEHPVHGAVALKTVQLESESMLAGLRREIRSLRGIEHPGVVRYLDEGSWQGAPFYTMELLAGDTLRAALTSEGTALARAELLTHFVALCRTLAFLHGKGVVHRDLKPENVMLVPGRGPVLVDFGIAVRSVGAAMRESIEATSRVFGSPSYMAPEQIRGELVDARADLYALGCILFESLAGRPPFDRESTRALLARKLAEDAPRLSTVLPGAPVELEQLCARLLARNPVARVGHADDVAAVLLRLGGTDAGAAHGASDAYLYRPRLAGRAAALKRAELLLSGVWGRSGGRPSGDGARAAETLAFEPGADEAEGRFTASRPVVAPEDEVEPTFVATLDVTSSEPHGRASGGLLLVGGESGVGKTRLVVEVSAVAGRAAMVVVSGQCDELDRGLLHPFAPFLTAVADLCRADGSATTYAHLLGPRAATLGAFEPSVAALAEQHGEPTPEPLPAEAERERVFVALKETLAAYAEHAPLLLVLDDLQWADELSLAFLRALTPGWLAAHPLVVIATHRLEESQPELDLLLAERAGERLVLDRLDAPGTEAVARDMLAAEAVDPELLRFLVASSEGNPFFIAEYLRAALAQRALTRDASGRWRWDARAGVERAGLPRSLVGLIGLRFAGLGPDARRTARALAVLGREASGRVLSVVLGEEHALAGEAVSQLMQRWVIEEHEPGAVRFVHDKLREVVYEELRAEADAERRALHRAAGEALLAAAGDLSGEEERLAPALAHHFAEAGDATRAFQHLERAGASAMAEGSYREAAGYFLRAAALAREHGEVRPAPSRVASWVRQAAKAEHAIGDLRSAERHGREALRIATGAGSILDVRLEDSLAGRAAFAARAAKETLAQLLTLRERPIATPAASEVGDRGATREAALAAEKLGETYMFLNDQARAAISTVLAGNHAARLGSSPELARASAQLALAAGYVPAHRLSRVYAERARTIARALRDPRTDLDVEFMRGFWLGGVADGGESMTCLSRSLRLARELSDRRREEESLALLAMVEAIHGRHADALDHFGELHTLANRSQNAQSRFWASTGRSQVWMRLGRTNATLEDYERLQPYIRRSDDMSEKIQLVIPSLIHAERGDHTRAAEMVERFLQLTREAPPASFHLFWSYSSACDTAYLLAAADPRSRRAAERVRETALRMRQFARVFPLGSCEADRADGLLAVREGALRRARRLFASAIAHARAFDLPVEEGRAHAALARHAAGVDRRARHARAARELFERFGTWALLRGLD